MVLSLVDQILICEVVLITVHCSIDIGLAEKLKNFIL